MINRRRFAFSIAGFALAVNAGAARADIVPPPPSRRREPPPPPPPGEAGKPSDKQTPPVPQAPVPPSR